MRICRLGGTVALAALLPLALASGSAGETASASVAGAVTTISLPGIPAGAAVDPGTDVAYVTVPGTGVAVIDLATDTLTATIPVGVDPRSIAVDPDTGMVYVDNSHDDSVSVINGATNSVTATITGLTSRATDSINGVAVDPVTDMVYVGIYEGGGISGVAAINGLTNTVTGTITGSGGYPESVAVDPATNTVYEACGSFLPYTLLVINAATNSLSSTIPQPDTPEAIAVDPATDMFYVANYGETVTTYSGATDAVSGTVNVGGLSYGLAVNPDTDTVYATPSINVNNVSLINGAGTAVTGTIPLAYPDSVAVNPDTDSLLATDSTYGVSVISLQPPAITSGDDATFTVGRASSFTIEGSGTPAPTFTESGSLPAGLTLTPSGTLGGTPASGTAGTYTFTVTASNGVPPAATQALTLTVNQAPAITSANKSTFTVGHAGGFAVKGSGSPAPRFSESGRLPAGVTFTPSGTLAGTPARGTGGIYKVTITASNGVAPAAAQAFTLTVHQAPTITSAGKATFRHGVSHTFTVRSAGYPAAKVTESGKLPPGLRFVAKQNGTAVITGKPAASDRGRRYVIRLTANNGVIPAATQRFTIRVT
jgi:large repetitive protein